MNASSPSLSIHSRVRIGRTVLHCKSVGLPRPQKARCCTLPRMGLVLASAAVTKDVEKLYQDLESAALELKRSPPSLVHPFMSYLTCVEISFEILGSRWQDWPA